MNLKELLAKYTEKEQIELILDARECEHCSDLGEHLERCITMIKFKNGGIILFDKHEKNRLRSTRAFTEVCKYRNIG